jgi:hypothetical protein
MCIHCRKELTEEEWDNCHSCSDGKSNCNVIICENCEKLSYDNYFEYANGYLDICKSCYIIRCKEIIETLKQRRKRKRKPKRN